MSDTHDAFDRRLRAVHAQAVAQVPPRTLYALRVRRGHAASAATSARPGLRSGGWWAAAGLAAVFALTIGLRQPPLDGAPTDAAPPSLAAAGTAIEAAAWDEGLATLEEDPDLYLWVASQDSLILAME